MTVDGKTPPADHSRHRKEKDFSSVDNPKIRRAVGRGTLARRIMLWSGNLLATAVVVILSLTFGRQVLHWWRGDEPVSRARMDRSNGRLKGLGNPRVPHFLTFGDLPFRFERTVFEGPKQAALAKLRAKCRAVAVRFNDRQGSGLPVRPGFLRQLAEEEAVEQGEGWRMVQQTGPIISVVALHSASPEPIDNRDQAPEIGESVVSWGLGLRAPRKGQKVDAAPNRWTLFTCAADRPEVGAEARGALDVFSAGSIGDAALSLPPDSQRTLGIRVQGGGGVVGFVNPQRVASNRRFFNEYFEKRGWKREFGWEQEAAALDASFRASANATCDIQLQEKNGGGTRGIVTLTWPAGKTE